MPYQQYRPSSFNVLPPVVKNLLIINGLCYLATLVLAARFGIDLENILGLHYPSSDNFRIWQIVTYMFMHATSDGMGNLNFTHILFNMFALWMFGNALENFWGGKRFLIYYMITGIGAGIVQLLVTDFRLRQLYPQISPEELNMVTTKGYEVMRSGQYFVDPIANQINLLINSLTIGASGAVFGILVGFGMLFPNSELFIMFIPIPIKAKYAVILYAAVELFLGIGDFSGDNVAHFAHLGGALFGFILIKYWQKNNSSFY